MITRVVLAVALLLGASGCTLQTIGAPTGDMRLTAKFDDVQSLVVGHSVQISDIRVGTVVGIELSGHQAEVTMSLKDEVRVPVGTTAAIAKTSLLGENYVKLQPPGELSAGPYLASGAAIGKTSVQPDLEQISARLGPLLAALGGQEISTISRESAAALGGRGERLNTLIKRAAEVSDSYAAASTELGRAMDDLAELGHSLRAGSETIDDLPGNIQLATERLQNDRAQVKKAVQELTKLGESVNANVQSRHAARLAALLKRADGLLAAAVRGGEDLKALANAVVKFLNGPSVSHSGQALLFLWLKGFLPQPGTTARTEQRQPWNLMGPRP
ncbi:virulence factor Mce [Actinomadura sp. CNU-125]|uniref:MlaD family protein n=1 Tax=Actinomadura sp. CNU-125 TaxID=1904961 RepID=UPI000959C82C|nr:MlaD family protein [Actinomadura sp. CNU-125]OLT11996.1 virulence factor Mce [Actinomadura sp. CNU-125]